MLLQEIVVDENSVEPQNLRGYSSTTQFTKSDVAFPLTRSSRRSSSSIATLGDILPQEGYQSISSLHISARGVSLPELDQDVEQQCEVGMLDIEDTWVFPPRSDGDGYQDADKSAKYVVDADPTCLTMHDLPPEVQERVLDYIFGDMHSVSSATNTLRGKNVSSAMRHPRRKAVSDLALVSRSWRELVQGRIYRHIKIKGTRAGLAESEEYFCNHMHLTQHVRHIEYWVPVWGDKSPINIQTSSGLASANRNGFHQQLTDQLNESLMTASDPLGFSFQPLAMSATLSEIFSHTACFFPLACIFTLEGGHCKKSNMIRHFAKLLFPPPNQRLDKLSCVRTFSMRGAWNIMRKYADWQNIEAALPNLEEWHCSYAKPRIEADMTIDQILHYPSPKLRHINLTLDGIYSKEQTILASNNSSLSIGNNASPIHICDRVGAILPQLESFSYTGKVCECMWTSATSFLSKTFTAKSEPPRLQSLEIVVKSCCRQRVTTTDVHTGHTITEEIGGILADGTGIGNLVFIKAFERLIYHTVSSLHYFPSLKHIRIRYIDLDSPCTLLNPYWTLRGDKVYGIWNEEIVERLSETRPEASYVELGDGIRDPTPALLSKEEQSRLHQASLQHGSSPFGVDTGDEFSVVNDTESNSGEEMGSSEIAMNASTTVVHSENRPSGPASLYPRTKPLSIKTSSYKILADMRS